MTDDEWHDSDHGLTEPELIALLIVAQMYEDNVREQPDEYDDFDVDQATVTTMALSDWNWAPEARPSGRCLYDAIWIGLDTPDAFIDLNQDDLKSAARKVGYNDDDPDGRLADDT